MTILVNEFWWRHSLEAIPKANFIASDNVYVLFNSMESFGESKTINTRSNNKTYIEKIVFVWQRAKKKKKQPQNIFTCSWQNLLSSVGFDLFVVTSSSFANRSGRVTCATLTLSSFSGVIIPDSQERTEHLNFNSLTMSKSEKLYGLQI